MTITSTDKYRIVGEVGSGGMGIVYRAVQTQLDRTVAIKVLKPRYSRDPSFIQRFRQEARALAALPHTHIVQVYDIERVGDDLWIIMEWVEGRTLRDVLKEEGPLPWERLIPLLRQCGAALATAHNAGVVHRDVKPENILLAADDTVKVMDFGVAMFLDPARNAGEAESMGMGSPRYMAPEQLAGEPTDARADQYALGLVAFEMATGAFPFAGSDVYAIGYEKLHRDAIPLTDVVPDAPPHVAAALARALSRDPAERFEDVAQLLDAIDPAPVKQLPLAPFALGATVAFVLLLGGFYFLRPQAPPVVVQAPPPIILTPPPLPAELPVTPPPVEPEPEPEPDPVVPLLANLDTALADERYDEAAALVEEIFSHDPEQPRARAAEQQIDLVHAQEQLLSDAVSAYKDGALGEAKGMFRAVLATQADNAVAQDYIARIERRERIAQLLAAAREAQASREMANAKQAYQDVLALEPKHGEATKALQTIAAAEARTATLARAESALETGDLTGATTLYENVLAEDPTNVAAGRGLARIDAIQRAQAQFDGTAYAAEVRQLSARLEEGMTALHDAVVEQERAYENGDARRVGRAARTALRTYERRITPPLEQLARSAEGAAAEIAAFSAQLEKVTDTHLTNASGEQREQQERLQRSLATSEETLAAEGGALAAGPMRTVQRAHRRLLGAPDAKPVNDAVLVYRGPTRFGIRLGPDEDVDPGEMVASELAALRAALDELVAESEAAGGNARASAELLDKVYMLRDSAERALDARVSAIAAAEQALTSRGTTQRQEIRAQVGAALEEARVQAEQAAARYREALQKWRGTVTEASTRSAAHFERVDQRTQAVATKLAHDGAEFGTRMEARLATEQRAEQEHLETADAERLWLRAQAQAVAACTDSAQMIDVVGRVGEVLPERAEKAGATYTGVRADFDAAGQGTRDSMDGYRRERTTLLKTRVGDIRGLVRDTAAGITAWEQAQKKTLRASATEVRSIGADMEEAVDAWSGTVAKSRAVFGGRSRSAFREFQQAVQRATRSVGETEPEVGSVLAQRARGEEVDIAPVVARLAELAAQVEGVVGAIEAYERSLEAAGNQALAERNTAAKTLLGDVRTHATALRTTADTFYTDARLRAKELHSAVSEILEESAAALEQFEAAAAATAEKPTPAS